MRVVCATCTCAAKLHYRAVSSTHERIRKEALARASRPNKTRAAETLAADTGIGSTTARKVFAGLAVHHSVAVALAAALADQWGLRVPAGDLAIGEQP